MEQRIKFKEFYIENQRSIVLIQSIHALFPGQESPAKPAVGHLVQRFQRQKNVGGLPRGESRFRARQGNTELAPQRFRGDLGRPGLMLCRTWKVVTSWQCMQTDLHRDPFKVQLVHGFKTRTVQQLKGNLQKEIPALGPGRLRATMENAIERALACKAENKVIFVASFFIKVQKKGHPVEKT